MSAVIKELPMVHLKIGEMRFSDQPMLVVTVLGSCLSVTFYSRRLAIGGICHGIYPSCPRAAGCHGDCAEKFRYVDCSIRQMVKLFGRFGCSRGEIEVKCFGGADIYMKPLDTPGLISVGRQNIAVAEAAFRSEGLTPAARDVGGPQGRKLFFYTHTGEVLLKRLTNARGDEGQ